MRVHSYVLSRNHFAVEEGCLCTVLLIILLDKSESILDKLHILRIVIDFDSKEFRSLHKSVDTDRKVLTTDIDESSIKERKHSLCLKGLEVLVISELNLMHKVHNLSKICQVVSAVLDRILDAAVKVDREHALGSSRHSAGTKGIAESVVLDLITQTAT